MNKLIPLIAIVLLTACRSGKYIAEIKETKRAIDTLYLLPVNVNIYASNIHNIDKEASKIVKEQLSNKVNDLLSKKYIIITDTSNVKYNSTENEALDGLVRDLMKQKNPIKNIHFPGIFDNLSKNNIRYCLMLYMNGHYTEGISPYEKATREVVYITPANFAGMQLNALLFDNKTKGILLFDESSSRDDPRAPLFVDRLSSGVLKQLYYK